MKVIVRDTQYLGRRARCKEIRQAGPSGEREIRILWIDASEDGQWPAGTVISRTITGNFARNTGRILVPTHVVDEF